VGLAKPAQACRFHRSRQRRGRLSCSSHPIGGWILTRYDDIVPTFRDVAHFSNYGRFTKAVEYLPTEARKKLEPFESHYRQKSMLQSDPPDHTRLRALIVKVFNRASKRQTCRIRNGNPFLRWRGIGARRRSGSLQSHHGAPAGYPAGKREACLGSAQAEFANAAFAAGEVLESWVSQNGATNFSSGIRGRPTVAPHISRKTSEIWGTQVRGDANSKRYYW
jgi:hypothetical protein